MDITNTSGKPLSVPLPGGKKLFLGPGKTGQVTEKALKHPALMKLIEAGEIKPAADGKKRKDHNTSGSSSKMSSPGHLSGTGAMRQSGDR